MARFPSSATLTWQHEKRAFPFNFIIIDNRSSGAKHEKEKISGTKYENMQKMAVSFRAFDVEKTNCSIRLARSKLGAFGP